MNKGQGVAHWFVARYLGGNEDMLESIQDMFEVLVANNTLVQFATDITKSKISIKRDIGSKDLSGKVVKKIAISKLSTVSLGDYNTYSGMRNDRVVQSNDIVSTYNEVVSTVETILKDGIMTFSVEDGPVVFSSMVKKVEECFEEKNIDVKILANKETIFVSELAGGSYDVVESKKPEVISCEKITSVAIVVNELKKWKDLVQEGKFGTILKPNIGSISNNVAVTYTVNGVKVSKEFSFSRVLKYFLDPGHRLHHQDVARAMAESLNVPYVSKTPDAYCTEFKVMLENKFEDINRYAFSDSWADAKDFNIDDLNDFIPVFTGLDSVPFVMLRSERKIVWGDSKKFHRCCNLIRKIAKMLGLWIRMGMRPLLFSSLVLPVVSKNPLNPISIALEANFRLWYDKHRIVTYVKPSLLIDTDPDDEFDFDSVTKIDEDIMLDLGDRPEYLDDDTKYLNFIEAKGSRGDYDESSTSVAKSQKKSKKKNKDGKISVSRKKVTKNENKDNRGDDTSEDEKEGKDRNVKYDDDSPDVLEDLEMERSEDG